MSRIVVITGGSSGIGKAAAALFAARGDIVYELSRGGTDAPGVRHIGADVTDQAQIDAAMAQVDAEQGKIDLLINNAGMGISGAIEFTPEAHAQRIFDVNFFGTFRCCKAALPYLRKSADPRIINTSAVGAMEKDELGGMPPQAVAAVLLKAADARSPRPFYTAGTKYKFFVFLAKFLPARTLNWLVGKVY